MRFSVILTSEQAAMLFDLVKEHRALIIGRSSFGVFDGLLVSLAQIDRGGGATLREYPLYGRDIVAAAIIPAATYIASPGVKTVPGPFLEPVRMPDLKLRELYWCRARDSVMMVPLPPVVVPTLPLR